MEKWMSKLKDDRKLIFVNIPGTHDSAACYMNRMSFNWARTQNLRIADLLKIGVRRLDIRIVQRNDNISEENDDFVLNVYKKNNLNDIKKVLCSITDKNNINYTLNCQQTETFEPNISNAYAQKGNDILIVNYNYQETENDGTNSTVFFNKEKSGISAGGIVDIILCTIAAIAAVFGVLYFLKGTTPAPKKPEVIESAEHISRTQAVSETNLN